jgi:quinol monooxygenase YgiN
MTPPCATLAPWRATSSDPSRELGAFQIAMSDSAVLLIGEIHGRTALVEDLEALLGELATASRAEPLCSDFRVLRAEERGELVLLAAWNSEAAMREHYSSEHYRRYREQVGPLLARDSDTVIHRLAGSVHARDPDPPDPGMLG